MKSFRLVHGFALGVVAVALVAGSAAEAATRTIKFTNKTGQAADDLHIETVQSTSVDFSGGVTTPFTSSRGADPGGTHNLHDGTVANNATATVRLTSTAGEIKINKWWWTTGGTALQDGNRIGAEHTKDSGSGQMSFVGGNAAGNGTVRVKVGGVQNDFQTQVGATALQSAQQFKSFCDGFVGAGSFALINSEVQAVDGGHAVRVFGNVLGDPTTELSVEVLSRDSGQLMSFLLFDVPVPGASPAVLFVLLLVMMLAGSIVLIRQRRHSPTSA